MKTIQDTLNSELQKGKSIAWWARGYYRSAGNEHCPSIKIPVFDFDIKEVETKQPHETVKVLIDYLGSMMYINVRNYDLFYGWGGDNPPSKEGKYLRAMLESIKNS
jgi:hypothetical protein